jgi:glutathione S-transferase
MKLYSVPLSPNAARVRISIYRKELDIPIVPPVGGGLKSEAYLAVNPLGQIPALDLEDGCVITESAVILEYLEDKFPQVSLRPDNAEDLALARMFLRIPDFHIRTAIEPLFGMIDPKQRDTDRIENAFEKLNRGLSYINHFIEGGSWAVADKASIADCALIPMLNAVSFIGGVFGRPNEIANHHKLAAYWEAARVEPIHAKVIAEQLAATPRLS